MWRRALWGEGKYRRLDLTFYKTDKQYQPPILRKQPPILRKTATHIEKTCSAGSHRNTGQFMKCAWEIQKRKWGEIQSEKMQYCERTNWRRANGQTGGGAKSALALDWIDLERFWQCKSLNWHLCESKNVCKYGATMHIEGSRSLWTKNYPSQGLRSPNPLQRVGWGTWLG